MTKVGFFDSGVGGTCILAAFRRLCPDVATEYLADSANGPYGNRPPEEIVRLSVANTEALLRRGCNVIVVACNTATAAAIDHLRAQFPAIPFVGIEPALKPAALRSKTGVVLRLTFAASSLTVRWAFDCRARRIKMSVASREYFSLDIEFLLIET